MAEAKKDGSKAMAAIVNDYYGKESQFGDSVVAKIEYDSMLATVEHAHDPLVKAAESFVVKIEAIK